ncbi:hypothetical protein KRX57_06915 [Weeksellaceae bacterium TAE3-ERU29]|nr:hypothetical protein [Weeksellaceae bacterium TAE3-ERU29]
MRKLLILLFATFILLPMYGKEIVVNVIFENTENIKDFKGELYIKELNKTYPINGTEDFEITFPEEGNFTILLKEKNISRTAIYPAKITEKNTILIISLKKQTEVQGNIAELRLEDNESNFIVFGIVDETNSDEYLNFKKEFDVGFISKTDAIDPVSYKEAVENNRRLANLLNQKFGESWKSKLPIKLFGVE